MQAAGGNWTARLLAMMKTAVETAKMAATAESTAVEAAKVTAAKTESQRNPWIKTAEETDSGKA